MVDVRKLIEYNEEVRHRYFDSLAKLPWEELTKNREASFHSLRNIFIHTLGAVDGTFGGAHANIHRLTDSRRTSEGI
jgi:uncharacterized damage-inducible protein DinB